jgi:hypothetical protein
MVLAVGCDVAGSSKSSVVDTPADGLYAGSIQLEKKSFAAGVRVDTRTCMAPVLLQVDGAAEVWFEMATARCELGGLEGEVELVLEPVAGSTVTGEPIGMVSGTVPEMIWSGAFMSDGTFEAESFTSVESYGTRADWTISLQALSAEAAFDTGGDSGF